MKKCSIQFTIGYDIHLISVENLPIYEKNENGDTERIEKYITEEGVCGVIKSYMRCKNLSGSYHDIVVLDEQGNIIAQAENLSEVGSLQFTDEGK